MLHKCTALRLLLILLSLPVCFYTLRPMPTWHPEPASGYTPVPSAYIPPGVALQRKPSGSAARFPPSAAAERSEPSELHDRWTFSASMTALLELLKNADPEVKAQLRLALLT